jgi:MFS family permease
MDHQKKIVYLAGLIFSIPIALMSYINSSFLSSFIDEKFVGMVYFFGSIVSILGLLVAPRILRKMGGYRFLLMVIALDSITILVSATIANAWIVIVAFLFGFALNNVIFFSLDEFIKILSKNKSLGGTRGIYLTLTNLAWIFSQILFVAIGMGGNFSFRLIYIIAFFVMTVFFILTLLTLKDVADPIYDRATIFKYVKEFFRHKNLSRAYGLNFLLQIFYAIMIIYTPIYLSTHMGFSWQSIGIIFAIMLTPFSIFPFSVGKYADKVGERKMLMLGFYIISISTLSLFFVTKGEVWIWATLLFFTRVGASTIEVMSDAYFFKHIEAQNDQYVGVYRSAAPVSYIVGPLVASLVFYFVPTFNFIYLVLGTIMLYGVYLSSMIRKSEI